MPKVSYFCHCRWKSKPSEPLVQDSKNLPPHAIPEPDESSVSPRGSSCDMCFKVAQNTPSLVYDIRDKQLRDRRAALKAALPLPSTVVYVPHIDPHKGHAHVSLNCGGRTLCIDSMILVIK